MSNARRLTEDNLRALLEGGSADVEIENDRQDSSSFNFEAFCQSHSKLQLTFNNGYTILRNRTSIFKMIKAGNYTFGGHKIISPSQGKVIGPSDFTFRRFEGFVRARMFVLIRSESHKPTQLKMYKKLQELPLVSAYGFEAPEAFDLTAARIILSLGGPLPLMASLGKFASIALPIAYFQNVKKESLGIKNFSTYEQLCKIARVLDARNYRFIDEDEKMVFDECISMIKDCTPGSSGSASLSKFSEQLAILESNFGIMVRDGFKQGGSSKPPPPEQY
nr:MAG: nucleocapsid [Mercurialis orthotospovirus 1]USL90360.1 MAG: nucleocapsid [Mercurialis orthotospovirus 1]